MEMLKKKLTVEEVARVLDIEDYSAKELLDGIIGFELDELLELAKYKGLTVGELLRA